MALFTLSGVLRGFPSAEYDLYASTKTLVRPCSSEKLLIYELETYPVPNACNAICGWTLGVLFRLIGIRSLLSKWAGFDADAADRSAYVGKL